MTTPQAKQANAGTEGGATRPNVVFFFADDWGWGDLSCHGHPYVKTPNIDRLAREGTDFHRFTVTSGVCSPSRCSILTGHFPSRYNIDGHFAHVPSNAARNMPDWLDTKAPLLPRALQEAGYRTAHYGKWHLANDMIPDSPLPSEYGYDDYGAFNCAGEQMPWYDDANRASGFIDQSVAEQKPFFINMWLHEPHTPFHTIPKYEWQFRHLDRTDQIYASVLAHADERIGQVLDQLEQLGILDETLVIFSSDNGPSRDVAPGEPTLCYDSATGCGWGNEASKGITGGRRGYKGALFEGGVGVPFIVRWPGKVAAGEVDESSLISSIDLLPTFCDVTGAKMPDGYVPDGASILDVLQGTPTHSRETPLFWKIGAAWPPNPERPDHWVSWAVTKGRWKLVGNQDLSYLELFDIAGDLAESNDLKEDKVQVAEDMLTELKRWQATLPAEPPERVLSSLRKEL